METSLAAFIERWSAQAVPFQSLTEFTARLPDILHYQIPDSVHIFAVSQSKSLSCLLGNSYFMPKDGSIPYRSSVFSYPSPESGIVHRHDFYECTYVAEGICRYRIADTIVELRQGDSLLMDTNCIHWDIRPETDSKLVYLSFNQSLLLRFASKTNSDFRLFRLFHTRKNTGEQRFLIYRSPESVSCEETAEQLLLHILRERCSEGLNYKEVITLLAERFLYLLENSCSVSEHVSGKSTRDDFMLLEIDRHISEHLSTVSAASLKKDLHFNACYYNRLIKKQFGITLTRYIQQKRLNEVKRLLTCTNLPVHTLIERVGYRNRNYFYALFLEETGMTPQAYRNSRSGGIEKEGDPSPS